MIIDGELFGHRFCDRIRIRMLSLGIKKETLVQWKISENSSSTYLQLSRDLCHQILGQHSDTFHKRFDVHFVSRRIHCFAYIAPGWIRICRRHMNYALQIVHFHTQIPQTFAAQRIQIDRLLDALIEPHGGRRMKNDIHIFFEHLQIAMVEANIRFRYIASDKDDLLQSFRMIFTNAIEYLRA